VGDRQVGVWWGRQTGILNSYVGDPRRLQAGRCMVGETDRYIEFLRRRSKWVTGLVCWYGRYCIPSDFYAQTDILNSYVGDPDDGLAHPTL